MVAITRVAHNQSHPFTWGPDESRLWALIFREFIIIFLNHCSIYRQIPVLSWCSVQVSKNVFIFVLPPTQVCMSMFPWKLETGWDCRSTRKTVSIARPVTSRTQAKTSTGWCQKAAADQPTMGCKVVFFGCPLSRKVASRQQMCLSLPVKKCFSAGMTVKWSRMWVIVSVKYFN